MRQDQLSPLNVVRVVVMVIKNKVVNIANANAVRVMKGLDAMLKAKIRRVRQRKDTEGLRVKANTMAKGLKEAKVAETVTVVRSASVSAIRTTKTALSSEFVSL